MDKDVKDIVQRELVALKARVVLQETQLATLDSMPITGAQSEQITQTKNQTKTQLQFDKTYAVNLEKLLATEVKKEETKESDVKK